MKFSVIIPVYNVQDYVSACLDSVLSQKGVDLQIIVVNDGSKDNSLDVVLRYQDKNPSIQVIDQKNTGLSGARNHGLKYAIGDYILFLDSDDRFCDNALVELEKFIKQREDSEVIVTNLTNHHESYIIQEYPYRSAKYLRYIKTNNGREFMMEMLSKEDNWELYAWNMVYKRDFLLKHGFRFVDDLYYEDMIFTWEILLTAQKVYYFPKPLVIYTRKRKGQITGQVTQRHLLDQIFIGAYWLKRVDDYQMNEKEKHLMLSKVANLYTSACFLVGSLEPAKRVLVYQRLEENRDLLRYANNPYMFVTQKTIDFIGFKKFSKVFSKNINQFFRAFK